jgi:hypothetical protein
VDGALLKNSLSAARRRKRLNKTFARSSPKLVMP